VVVVTDIFLWSLLLRPYLRLYSSTDMGWLVVISTLGLGSSLLTPLEMTLVEGGLTELMYFLGSSFLTYWRLGGYLMLYRLGSCLTSCLAGW